MNSEALQYALSFIVLGNQAAALAAAHVVLLAAAVLIFAGYKPAGKAVLFSAAQIAVSVAVMFAALNQLSGM